jgi:hypothetical protein
VKRLSVLCLRRYAPSRLAALSVYLKEDITVWTGRLVDSCAEMWTLVSRCVNYSLDYRRLSLFIARWSSRVVPPSYRFVVLALHS